jgi:hypothetical protein
MYCWSREPSREIMCTTIMRSGEALRTVTPRRWTVSGRRGCATATRFCTSTWSVSMLVPGLNTTSIDRVPSPTDCEVMYSMLSTPFTSCSIGVATVSDTTCADAPG